MRRAILAAMLLAGAPAALADPLPCWNAAGTEAAIVDFVTRVADPASPDFVPAAARIAVFDDDGALWSEKPFCFQGLYALQRLRGKAAADSAILKDDALEAAAKGDPAPVPAGGETGLVEILDVSHAGLSVDAFQADAQAWLTPAKHPTSGLTCAEMTFQPMLELPSHLRGNGFSTYIVSGGGVDAMRAIARPACGARPWQVVGSEGGTGYAPGPAGAPVLLKEGGVASLDDGPGKPVGIERHIGQRPISAAGNSDGDLRCSSGPPPARALAPACSSITPTGSGNSPSTEPSRRPPPSAGRRST